MNTKFPVVGSKTTVGALQSTAQPESIGKSDSPKAVDGFQLGGTAVSLPNGSAVAIKLPATNAPLTAALDAGQPDVVKLYGSKPIPELHAAIKARTYDRAAIVDLLRGQNEARGAKQPVLDNIERLRSPDTVTVVTGQQVGLLGGPLYSLFKALGAVNEAAALTARGIDAVPIFWLASYDHDLAEVNHVGVLGQGQEPTTVKLEGEGRMDLIPVGDQKLGASVGAFLDQVEASLLDSPHKAETMARSRAIYTPDETYAGAFAKFIGQLTDDHGLVILDPNRREFNALAKPVFEKELFGEPTGPLVAEAIAELDRLGFEPQIAARDDRLNVFFIDDEGRRVALTKTDGGFNTGGTPAFVDDKSMRNILENSPERLSPSALLRPVVEDKVLPTIGYVGGPAERKYYAQVGKLYEWADVPAPQAMRRPSFYVANNADVKTVTEATGRSILELFDDPNLGETLGTAGVPESIRAAYAPFDKHRERLSQIVDALPEHLNQGTQKFAVRDLGELKKALRLSFTRAGSAVRDAGLERLERGLAQNEDKVIKLLDGFIKSIEESDPSAGRTPKLSPVGGIMKSLQGMSGQLVKVGRQERPELVSIMSRLRPLGSTPQERKMSVAQLVSEMGPKIADVLVDRANVHQTGPELVIIGATS